VPIVLKYGSLKLLEPSGPVQTCNGIPLPAEIVLLLVLFLSRCSLVILVAYVGEPGVVPKMRLKWGFAQSRWMLEP
jgi:hypothetical protein